MNENLKQIAIKAQVEHCISHVRLQEFAELIVKECLDISHNESHLHHMVIVDERTDKFIKDIHNRVDRATRKHFGIEE